MARQTAARPGAATSPLASLAEGVGRLSEDTRILADARTNSILLMGNRSDITALAAMLSNLSGFAHANRDRVESIDLNPVRVMPEGQGVLALDALLIVKERVDNDHI